MKKKTLAILFLTLTSGFILPTHATTDFSSQCRHAWSNSPASHKCVLTNAIGYLDNNETACKLKVKCTHKVKSPWISNVNSFDSAQLYLKDVHRLIDCNGSLKYDRC